MRGRKPLPTDLKILRGNPGHRRIDADREPQPRAGMPEPPEHLDKEAKAQWYRWCGELAVMRVITMADREVLAIACDAWSRYLQAEAAVQKHGILVKSPNGYPIQNPALAIRNQAAKELLRFSQEFGLTPSARTRIKVDGRQLNLPGINPDNTPAAPSGPASPLDRVRNLAASA